MHLPLLGARADNLESCTFCPKLCRAACPVTDADGREATTPWGIMSSAYLLTRGAIAPTVEHAATAWACTGCGACKTRCDLRNDVRGTVLDARADFHASGFSPDRARAVVDRHAARTKAADEGLARAAARARERGARVAEANDRPAATRLIVGCMTSRHDLASGDADVAADAIVAVSALTDAPIDVVFGCCGAPLDMAGDRPAFVAEATAMRAKLSGARSIVVADAGCARTIARRYREVEVGEVEGVVHVSELAARHLSTLPTPTAARTVRYAESCALSRGLGVHEAPRQVIARLSGGAPAELPRTRDDARCSGAGGLLPVTDRATSDAIVQARARELAAAGDGVVVTTCASSRRALRRQGVEAVDLVTLLAKALETTRA